MHTYATIPRQFAIFDHSLPEAIIFDWDNTIVNMRSIYQDAMINYTQYISEKDWNLEIISSLSHFNNNQELIEKILYLNSNSNDDSLHYNVIFTNTKKHLLQEKLKNTYNNEYFYNTMCNVNEIDTIRSALQNKKPEELWALRDINLQQNSFHEYIFHGSPLVIHICNDNPEQFNHLELFIADKCHKGNIDKIQLFDGIIDLLELCKKLSIPLFIVSNKNGDIVRTEAHILKIDHYFEKIVGANDTPYLKPSIEPALFALKEHQKISLEKCWFVGDSIFDTQTANNMNCLGIAVHHRCMSQDTLNLKCTSHITHIIHTILDKIR